MAGRRVTTSRVFDALRKRTEKIVVLEGSSRSTKTYSIIQHLISLALENENSKTRKPMRIAIVRARLTWLKNTVFPDFQNIMTNQFGLWEENSMNRTEFYYRLGSTTFVFTGVDHEQGQKFHGAKNDHIWLNEATELDYPSVRQMLLRLTGRMFIDYNPNMDQYHWLEQKIKKRPDVCVIHSTYKDNPFLEASVVQEIERLEPNQKNIDEGTADETAWKIYGLGLRAQIHGLVYPSWNLVKEMPISKNYIYGLDWGYSNDPAALVKTCIHDGELYLEEKLYEKGLTNIDNPSNPNQPSLERRFAELGITAKDIIAADSAEPKSIQDLKNCGYDIRGIKKGPGSVLDGITAMKRYKINIVESSTHLISEVTKYKWLENRDGTSLNRPIKGWDHLLDGSRYATSLQDELTSHGQYAYDSVKPRFRLVGY